MPAHFLRVVGKGVFCAYRTVAGVLHFFIYNSLKEFMCECRRPLFVNILGMKPKPAATGLTQACPTFQVNPSASHCCHHTVHKVEAL